MENKKEYGEFVNKLVIVDLVGGTWQKGILAEEDSKRLVLKTLNGVTIVHKNAIASIRMLGNRK